MKSRFTALAVLPMLSLLSAATMGAEIPLENIDVSANGTAALAGELKNQNACRDGTYFKNFTPGLTNGSDGGSSTVDIVVDGKLVPLTIEWGPRGALPENSFGFSLDGAYALEVGVTTNTNNFTYNYRSLNATTPVQSDSNLNKLREDLITAGEVIADVNHLDLCLAALDDEAPSVSITEPTNGGTVSGNVTIVATITDNEGLDSFEINIVSVPGGVPVDESLIVGPTISGTEYTWSFDSSGVDVGLYLITVAATDTSILANVGTAEVTVEVVRSLANCLGILDDTDLDPGNPDDPFGTGCNPSGFAIIQAAPGYDPNCLADDPTQPCIIGGDLLEADPSAVLPEFPDCAACGHADQPVDGINIVKSCGPGAFPDPRMDFIDGRWVQTQFEPLVVFQELGGAPAGESPDALVLAADMVGYRGCFGVVKHFKNFPLPNAYPVWPQDNPDTPDINEATGVVFVKKVFPDGDWKALATGREVVQCYDQVTNPDLQQAAEVGYQTSAKGDMVGGVAVPYTNLCGSGRTLTRNQSYEIFNVIENCDIDFTVDGGPELVLECKYQKAALAFDDALTAVFNAEPTIESGQFSAVSRYMRQAQAKFQNGTTKSLNQAINELDKASTAIREDTTWTVQEVNWPGDALGRIENLKWRLGLLIEEKTRIEGL